MQHNKDLTEAPIVVDPALTHVIDSPSRTKKCNSHSSPEKNPSDISWKIPTNLAMQTGLAFCLATKRSRQNTLRQHREGNVSRLGRPCPVICCFLPTHAILPCPRVQNVQARLSILLCLLSLEVIVGEVGRGTTDEDDGVDTDAQARGITGRGGRRDGTGLGGLGGRIAGL